MDWLRSLWLVVTCLFSLFACRFRLLRRFKTRGRVHSCFPVRLSSPKSDCRFRNFLGCRIVVFAVFLVWKNCWRCAFFCPDMFTFCKQLLDDFKEKRGYRKLKEEALYRTLWRTRFGRVFGPVVIHCGMNVY